jgi:hypothetical protein
MTLNIPLAEASSRDDIRNEAYRRTWTRDDLLAVLPGQPVRAHDVGAGPHPLRLRPEVLWTGHYVSGLRLEKSHRN